MHEKASAPLATDRSTHCLQEPVKDGLLPSLDGCWRQVEAETKKALGLDANDDLEAFCKRYEDAMQSTGGF